MTEPVHRFASVPHHLSSGFHNHPVKAPYSMRIVPLASDWPSARWALDRAGPQLSCCYRSRNPRAWDALEPPFRKRYAPGTWGQSLRFWSGQVLPTLKPQRLPQSAYLVLAKRLGYC